MQIEDFGPFTLSKSSHASPEHGMCVMEMVSFLAGEEWSDTPVCSSPVVTRFCQVINDEMGQYVRDKLQTYIPRLIGTASPKHDRERAEYLAWSAVRIFAPIAFRAAKMENWAVRLENLDGTLSDARKVCREAHAAADAATDDAAFAAYAAYAAADAAFADYAAAAYADAAFAATNAVHADYAVASDATFKVLDGLLEIGPSGSTYTQKQSDRIKLLKVAVSA